MVFRRRDLKLLAVLALVANALFLACLIANLGAFLMRRMIHLAALAAAAIALSACQGLQAFNSALVPELKPLDLKIHPDSGCGALARKVMGVSAEHPLTADQAVAIVEYCESRDASQTLQLDPNAGRKVLNGLANPVKAIGAAAGVPSP